MPGLARGAGATVRRGRRSRGRSAGGSPSRTPRTSGRQDRRRGPDRSSSGSTSRSSLNREMIVSKALRSASGKSGRTARMTSSRSSRGLTGSPAARSISRPRAWKVLIRMRAARSVTDCRERRLDALPELLGGAAVERDRADRLGLDAAVHEPRDPGDEGRGLARSRGRDAQDRPGRRRRRCPLVRLQSPETLGDCRVTSHMTSLASAAYPPATVSRGRNMAVLRGTATFTAKDSVLFTIGDRGLSLTPKVDGSR